MHSVTKVSRLDRRATDISDAKRSGTICIEASLKDAPLALRHRKKINKMSLHLSILALYL